MSKQRLCRICNKRPPWQDKNCPPRVCKRCYHRDIWPDRPAARKQREAQAAADRLHSSIHEDLDVLGIDDLPTFEDGPELVDDLAGDDEALVAWLAGPAFAPAPPWARNERELHFQIALQTADTQRRRDLIINLERLDCAIIAMEGETITGYLPYNPRYHRDRKATAELHKLLNRWQRKGQLTWSASRKQGV